MTMENKSDNIHNDTNRTTPNNNSQREREREREHS
uniref:Uncharacterized protein n=1 Tax=Arundo donax TaxID=35708 RepID=A0A0A9F7T1_ARUDO